MVVDLLPTFSFTPLFLARIAMSSIQIKITPSMTMDAVYRWLKKYANKKVSLCLVMQKIEYELAGIGIVYWEDLWGISWNLSQRHQWVGGMCRLHGRTPSLQV